MKPTPAKTLRMSAGIDSKDHLQMSPATERINPPNINIHSNKLIQPKLEVEDEYPQDYMEKLLPS